MNFKDFEVGFASYCKNKIMPKLPKTRDRWTLGAFLGALALRGEALLRNMPPMILNAGIIDVNGNIDIDLLEKVGGSGFDYQPTLDIWKLTFTREDFNELIAILRG